MTAHVRKLADRRMRVSGVLQVTGIAPIRLVAIRKDKLGRRLAMLEWDGNTYDLYPDDSFNITLNLNVDPLT